MKRKLLFAVLCIVSVLGLRAQTWTGNAVAEGTFYLYNVAAEKFLNNGDPAQSWGTNAYLQEGFGMDVVLTNVSDNVYTIDTNVSNGGDSHYLANTTWCDGGATQWTFRVVEGQSNVYQIINNGQYLMATTGLNDVEMLGDPGSRATSTYWKLVSEDDFKTAMQAKAYSSTSPMDVSIFIKGRSFARNDGRNSTWTTTHNGGNWVWIGATENKYFGNESWNNTFDVHQTIANLPDGTYEVRCSGFGTNGTTYIYGNTNTGQLQTDNTTARGTDKEAKWKAIHEDNAFAGQTTGTFTLLGEGLTVGVKRETNNGGDWCVYDEFRLYYYGFDRTEYEAALAAAVSAAEDVENTVPAAAWTALNTVITANNKSYTSAAAYTTATNAIVDATNTAKALQTNYSRYQAIRTAALDVSSGVVTSTADAQLATATTNDAINAAIDTLRAAFLAKLPELSIPVDPGYIDVTAVMVDNASVATNTNYWTIEGTPNGNYSWGVCNYGECEFYQQNFKFYQTLALTPGTWEFGVTGFHRAGNHNTNFYAGVDKILIPGVASNVVNSMAQAQTYFNNGNGKVALKFLIEEAGDVEIGIDNQDTQTDKWTIFRNFTLKYYGAPDYSVYEDQWDELVADATTAKTTYANCVGTELTALNEALADSPEDSNLKATYFEKIEALQTALTAFTAAGPNYEALAREIVKAKALGMEDEDVDKYAATSSTTAATALANTQDLMVDEYDYVDTNYSYAVELGAWNASANAGTLTGQHWDGTSTSTYLEQGAGDLAYNLNSWTVTYNQNLTLPAGNYVFKVAGRTATDHVTLTLNVTNVATSAVLGTVNDFPKGDTGLGINTSGATDFTAGEGHNYANSGNGRGWQWRYVKFTLASETTVNVGVVATADAQYRWMGFCNATVQTDEEANISLIAYNIALASAETVLADATYENVGGTDKSNLQAAIAADESLDKSDADAIDAATATLTSATNAFTSGVASWNAYVLAKGYADAITAVALPYATSAKITAVATAKNVTVNTAADAATQTAAINTANRTAYESNAIAENVPGVARTNLIQNPDGSNTAGWSGSFWTQTGEPYTEANGNSTNTYFDKNNVKSFTTSQTITLAAGTYILSVTARAQNGIDSYKMQVTNNADETAEVALTAMGNANGVFGRGWNDFFVVFEQKALGDATISIIGDNTTSNATLWMSWDRFRLYSIDDEGAYKIDESTAYTPVALDNVNISLARTIKVGHNTLVLPFDMTQEEVEAKFGTGSKVFEVDSYADGKVTFADRDGIQANQPVLLKATEAGNSYTINSRDVKVGSITDEAEDGSVSMIGSYENEITITADNDNYFIYGDKLYLVDGESTVKLKNTRAYFNIPSALGVKSLTMSFDDDIETGITTIENGELKIENAPVYNLSGQRVSKAQKGIYIVNGKKIVKK